MVSGDCMCRCVSVFLCTCEQIIVEGNVLWLHLPPPGPVEPQELANRLAPLASSTPSDKRRGSSPMVHTSSSESPYRKQFRSKSGKNMYAG